MVYNDGQIFITDELSYPIFAPLEAIDGPMPDSVVEQVALRMRAYGSAERKREQAKRLRMLRNIHDQDIADLLNLQWETDEQRRRHAKFIRKVYNPLEDVIRKVAVIWSSGATRRLNFKDEAIESNEALAKLVIQSEFDDLAAELNQVAEVCGPCLVIPLMRDGRITLDVAEPPDWEPILDCRNPQGMPIAAAYEISEGADPIGGLSFCLIDSVYRRYYRQKRLQNKQWICTEAEELREEHGLDFAPFAVCRLDRARNGDWWGFQRYSRLVDATLDVATTYSDMLLVRKGQRAKHLVHKGPPESTVAQGTNATETEMPSRLETTTGTGDVSLDALDLVVDPEPFLKIIRAITDASANATGVPMVVGSPDGITFDLTPDPNALSETRESKSGYAIRFESRLWKAAIGVAKAERHKWAMALPEPDELEDILSIEFPPLTPDPSTASAKLTYFKEAASTGLYSLQQIANYMGVLPRATPQQVKAQMLRNVAGFAEVWQIQSRENLDLEKGIQSPAQENGAKGGRPTKEEAEDDESPELPPEEPEDEETDEE